MNSFGRSHDRVTKKDIYIRGRGVIQVKITNQGMVDADGKSYLLQPDGSYIEASLKANKKYSEVDEKSLKPYENVELEDGTVLRYQPNEKGKFELQLVYVPKKITSLSPVRRSGYSKTTGSGVK